MATSEPMKPRKVVPDDSELFLKEQNFDENSTDEGQLACDVFQTDAEIVVVAPVAGVKKEDLDIEVTDDVLTVKGRRSVCFDVEEKNYYTQECFWGDFSRSVILPESVDVSRIKASFKNGIAIIRIPKVEKIRSRKIHIKEE
ncbi:MAG: Hsp20/alpha crystallin family protein [Patescibacteria group bacterium]